MAIRWNKVSDWCYTDAVQGPDGKWTGGKWNMNKIGGVPYPFEVWDRRGKGCVARFKTPGEAVAFCEKGGKQ